MLIQVRLRALTDVFPARHTGTCVCVCELGYLFVCVYVHMYVFACALEYLGLLGLPWIGVAQPVSSSENF